MEYAILANNRRKAQIELDRQILKIHNKLEEDNIEIERQNLIEQSVSEKIQLRFSKDCERETIYNLKDVKEGVYKVEETDTEYLLRLKRYTPKYKQKITEELPTAIITKREYEVNHNYCFLIILTVFVIMLLNASVWI